MIFEFDGVEPGSVLSSEQLASQNILHVKMIQLVKLEHRPSS